MPIAATRHIDCHMNIKYPYISIAYRYAVYADRCTWHMMGEGKGTLQDVEYVVESSRPAVTRGRCLRRFGPSSGPLFESAGPIGQHPSDSALPSRPTASGRARKPYSRSWPSVDGKRKPLVIGALPARLWPSRAPSHARERPASVPVPRTLRYARVGVCFARNSLTRALATVRAGPDFHSGMNSQFGRSFESSSEIGSGAPRRCRPARGTAFGPSIRRGGRRSRRTRARRGLVRFRMNDPPIR